jgi:hypothetical protein
MDNLIGQSYREFLSTHKDYEKAEQHYTNLTDEEAIVFVHKKKMIATAFSGKKATQDWSYRFRDERERRKYIQDYFVKCKQAQELKIERAAARINKKREFFASIKEGDIFVDSWGYDQTNVDYYVVTKKLKASIKVRQIGKIVEYGSHGANKVTPNPLHYLSSGEEMNKIPQDGHIKIDGYRYAVLWDGVPNHETAAGWGH